MIWKTLKFMINFNNPEDDKIRENVNNPEKTWKFLKKTLVIRKIGSNSGSLIWVPVSIPVRGFQFLRFWFQSVRFQLFRIDSRASWISRWSNLICWIWMLMLWGQKYQILSKSKKTCKNSVQKIHVFSPKSYKIIAKPNKIIWEPIWNNLKNI